MHYSSGFRITRRPSGRRGPGGRRARLPQGAEDRRRGNRGKTPPVARILSPHECPRHAHEVAVSRARRTGGTENLVEGERAAGRSNPTHARMPPPRARGCRLVGAHSRIEPAARRGGEAPPVTGLYSRARGRTPGNKKGAPSADSPPPRVPTGRAHKKASPIYTRSRRLQDVPTSPCRTARGSCFFRP